MRATYRCIPPPLRTAVLGAAELRDSAHNMRPERRPQGGTRKGAAPSATCTTNQYSCRYRVLDLDPPPHVEHPVVPRLARGSRPMPSHRPMRHRRRRCSPRRNAPPGIGHGAAGRPYRALVWVGCYAGPRIGELAALRWTDVDLDARTLSISRKVVEVSGHGIVEGGTKTKAGRRTVTLPRRVVAELERYRARFPSDPLVFTADSSGPTTCGAGSGPTRYASRASTPRRPSTTCATPLSPSGSRAAPPTSRSPVRRPPLVLLHQGPQHAPVRRGGSRPRRPARRAHRLAESDGRRSHPRRRRRGAEVTGRTLGPASAARYP
jgi:hypothetical protein